MAFVRRILSGNNRVWVLLPAMFFTVVAWGCGPNANPATPATPGVPLLSGAAGGSAPLTAEEIDAITLSIQDEYHALFTYTKVIADLGELKPFSKIVLAETKHVNVVGRLFTKHGLGIPASEWSESNVTTFVELLDACIGGRDAEIVNVALYDELLLTPNLPKDIAKVFTKLRTASLNHHLPAFEKCIARESR